MNEAGKIGQIKWVRTLRRFCFASVFFSTWGDLVSNHSAVLTILRLTIHSLFDKQSFCTSRCSQSLKTAQPVPWDAFGDNVRQSFDLFVSGLCMLRRWALPSPIAGICLLACVCMQLCLYNGHVRASCILAKIGFGFMIHAFLHASTSTTISASIASSSLHPGRCHGLA